MNDRKDNIYIYLWEEFNTVYVGRTVNPKCRHSQHKTRTCEKTYKFSSEHHVEHPKMIIIENDLTIEEGAEREKYWINYYKENTFYNVLNKTKGGETGLIEGYDEEKRKKWQKDYYQKNKEKIRAYQRQYQKEYRKEHKEEINEKDRIRYHKNKKPFQPLSEEEKKIRRREKQRQYRQKNKEKFLQYKKKYRDTHKDEIKERNKKYYNDKKSVKIL